MPRHDTSPRASILWGGGPLKTADCLRLCSVHVPCSRGPSGRLRERSTPSEIHGSWARAGANAAERHSLTPDALDTNRRGPSLISRAPSVDHQRRSAVDPICKTRGCTPEGAVPSGSGCPARHLFDTQQNQTEPTDGQWPMAVGRSDSGGKWPNGATWPRTPKGAARAYVLGIEPHEAGTQHPQFRGLCVVLGLNARVRDLKLMPAKAVQAVVQIHAAGQVRLRGIRQAVPPATHSLGHAENVVRCKVKQRSEERRLMPEEPSSRDQPRPKRHYADWRALGCETALQLSGEEDVAELGILVSLVRIICTAVNHHKVPVGVLLQP
mmetsp:Transcript_43425/g.73252  ORF Transcript_43425/g.73252 Transcript_43425/m.73252 type:complete len:324 (-) Transcript_43425:954-1925(-)